MINRIRRQTSPQQDNTPTSSVLSPSKFQRTNKKGLNTPEETNVTSEISEPVSKIEVEEKTKPLARTTRPIREFARSPTSEEPQASRLQRTTSPAETSKITPKVGPNPLTSEKKETSEKQTPSKMELGEKGEQNSVKLKRSNALIFLVLKLGKQSLSSAVLKLKSNRRNLDLKSNIESKCLLFQISDFARRYELKLYALAFQKFKLKMAKEVKENFQTCQETSKNNSEKAKNYLSKVLSSIFQSRLADSFKKLKDRRTAKNNCEKVFNCLFGQMQKKKMKQGFFALKEKAGVRWETKNKLLSQVVSGYSFCSKQNLHLGFRKVSTFAASIKKNVEETKPTLKSPRTVPQKTSPLPLPSPQNNELISKKEKISAETNKITEDIQGQEQALSRKKNENADEEKRIKKEIQQSKNSKRKLEKQLSDKKSANQLLKKKVDSAKPQTSQDLNTEEEQNGQIFLLKLQKLYSQLYKARDECDSSFLFGLLTENYIEMNLSGSEEWELIERKAKLQRQIDLFENSILGSSSGSDQNSILKLVREENEMVRNLIKNFIKERYLWGEVEKFVAAVL